MSKQLLAKVGVFAIIAANLGAYYLFWPDSAAKHADAAKQAAVAKSEAPKEPAAAPSPAKEAPQKSEPVYDVSQVSLNGGPGALPPITKVPSLPESGELVLAKADGNPPPAPLPVLPPVDPKSGPSDPIIPTPLPEPKSGGLLPMLPMVDPASVLLQKIDEQKGAPPPPVPVPVDPKGPLPEPVPQKQLDPKAPPAPKDPISPVIPVSAVEPPAPGQVPPPAPLPGNPSPMPVRPLPAKDDKASDPLAGLPPPNNLPHPEYGFPPGPPASPRNESPAPATKIIASPWTVQMEIADGRTTLTARLHKKTEFKIVCDRVEMKTPDGVLLAVGKVVLTAAGMKATCEKLTLPLVEDRITLDGKVELNLRPTNQAGVELKGEQFSMRLTLPTEAAGPTTRVDANVRPASHVELPGVNVSIPPGSPPGPPAAPERAPTVIGDSPTMPIPIPPGFFPPKMH